MTWNWQRPEWPDFTWQRASVARAEELFLLGGGVFLGTVNHLDPTEAAHLMVEALSVRLNIKMCDFSRL